MFAIEIAPSLKYKAPKDILMGRHDPVWKMIKVFCEAVI